MLNVGDIVLYPPYTHLSGRAYVECVVKSVVGRTARLETLELPVRMAHARQADDGEWWAVVFDWWNPEKEAEPTFYWSAPITYTYRRVESAAV